MTLPAGQVPAPCIPERKIAGYLLDVDHPEGGPKAEFFLGHGFSRSNTAPFIQSLLEHGRADYFIEAVQTPRALKHVHEGLMRMPDGSEHRVRSVWRLVEHGLLKMLVTAYRF